jgi:hypothetical protein
VTADLLRIYLQDHRAAATAGRELAARALGSNRGSEFEGDLEWLLGQIEQDMASLDEVMEALDVSHDRLKKVALWTGEKLGRLKLNGRLLSYSPLSRLVEIEGLIAGVTAKGSLWNALQTVAAYESRLAGFDLEALASRADEQRARLEELRTRAAAIALRD